MASVKHSSQRLGDSTAEARQRGLWRVVVLRAVACLVGVLAIVAVVVLALVHSLDRPWFKRRLQGLVRASSGVEVDYRATRIELLSGVEIDDLIVRSPVEVRPFAADLVRVGRVEARWSLKSLLLGRGPRIERLAVSDAALIVVVDENGRTSFDAVSPSRSTPESAPTVPLSQQASKFLGTTPPVGRLDVNHLALTLIRTDHGAVSDRTELRGVSATLGTSSAEPTSRGWRVQAALGSPAAALEVQLMRERSGVPADTAHARLWVVIDATSSALTAALDLRMIDQTFAASLSPDHWFHAEASLGFDKAAGRTELRLDRVEAGDGSVTAQASMEVSDAGNAIVRRAQGDIDLGRLLRWLPAGLAPVTVKRARVRCQVDSLEVMPVIGLSQGGAVAVDADFADVVVGTPSPRLQVGEGEVSLRAQAADGMMAGRVAVRFARVEQEGATSLVARDGHVDLNVQGLRPDTNDLAATRGDLALSIDLTSLEARSSGSRSLLDGLTIRAHTHLDGHAPYGGELEALASRLRVFGRDGNLLADTPARLEGQIRDLLPDVAVPMATRGVVRAAVDLGGMHASLDATKEKDAVEFALQGAARSLKCVRPFLSPASTDQAPWDEMAVSVRSSGHLESLVGLLALRQTTEIDVEHPAFKDMAAQSLSLILKSQGTALRHHADLDLHAQGFAFGGVSPSDDHVTLSTTVDRQGRSIHFQLATEGHANSKLSGSLSFDPSRHAIPYELNGHIAGLAALGALAAKPHVQGAFDLSQLEIEFASRGALFGVAAGAARNGTIELEPNLVRTAALEGKTDLRIAHLRWTRGDTAISTPVVAWHGEMRTSGVRRVLDSHVEIGTVHLDLGNRDVDLNGITDDASVTVVGNLTDPDIELAQHLEVRAVEQTVVPEYPLGNVAFALSAERGSEGVVRISDMKVANGLAGTALTLSGNIEVGDERRSLSLITSLTQDLARLSAIPERFRGRGKVSIEANVTSPDFAHYHVRAAVKGEDVTATLSHAGIEVDSANGEVPITVALEIGENGVALERSEKRSPYSMLRFADQHPLLNRSGFLSINRLKTPYVSIAPLVGNLAVEQNVVSLRQFEMGVRGGTITGQCGVDWDGPKSTLELHVRASGVQSSHGEPFDGNIAVTMSAADRTINGRAEILRIGERHLLDLLDLQDPLHVDPAMNRVRSALRFGYPDTLRLVFDHGFASAHLELGGLARLVSIGELRGIPMGPIVDKMIARVLEGPTTEEIQ